MRTFLYISSMFLVLTVAFWAYNENYKTQDVLKEIAHLQSEIGVKRERLGMLEAEWAYLNRPERLRELAEINFDSLGLLPFLPTQFGKIDQVAFPAADLEDELGPITSSIEVIGSLEGEGQ
ncbi:MULTISPECIES: cell division protein FtsL [Halocynthiibacter]|uniref:Cell division protein FtsL n=1 Tax=Halocynthiibacter halioticoli TaxID=2986804 RepID=A0AAE3J3I4_9RHOB|nr:MULTISPECIES: cell division protein FtsL [Halocynthiibacter]MCV6824762.1 cell division protein FtsL [Halocynthiibacter halioticoli]MCW4057763.1 cell division protein FtsL [Halocynthiibacter sp. SDUM655004]MDE0589197.1 cell division protein FtsL [Halocynthiibacter sp. C4]